MGNCLVTKLKEVVDNNNLPVFNAIDFVVSNTATATDTNYRMYVQPTEALTATIIGEGSFRSDSSMSSTIPDKTVSVSGYLRFTPGNYKIRFNKMYSILAGTISIGLSVAYDVNMFKWNQGLTIIELSQPTDWNVLMPLLNKDEVVDLTVLPAVNMANLSLLNGFVKLNALQVTNSMLVGDIKDWVVAQVNAGRTTNSAGTNFKYCPALKFNGTTITSKSPNKVTWSPVSGGTSITMDGLTIVVDSNGNVIG